MQRHPSELASRWLEQCDRNLTDARDLLERDRFHLACFLAQQAAEMSLKAALVWFHGDYPRVHLIRTLIEELASTEWQLPDEVARRARTLDKFYTTTRYPDALDYALPAEAFTPAEAKEALEIAEDVAKRVHTALDPHIGARP
jgi:HEPN domain-containing protein